MNTTAIILRWTARTLGTLLLILIALFAIVNHGVPLNVVFGPWLLTALLYLACWRMRPKRMVAT